MLIAQLIRYTHPDGQDTPIYAATHPFDGKLLTGWFDTITEVDEALKDVDDTMIWGLNIAAYAGESDVPTRPSGESCGCSLPSD